MKPEKSKMMDMLYGEDTSKVVYDRCQELSSNFNKFVQEVVYDIFWARPGLALKEKSLVTIITLIMFQKEEQLRIHLQGFFNLGGTPQDIVEFLRYMTKSGYIPSSDKTVAILKEVTSNFSESDISAISPRDKAIIDLTAHIAMGDQDKTKKCMSELLKNNFLLKEEMENIMLHEMVYSGFPCAMNGFAVLTTLN